MGRPARLLACGLVCTAALAPLTARAHGEQRYAVRIAAGTLDAALRVLAQQTGIAVGGTDAGLASVRTRAVSGTMTPSQALRRLLAGTRFRAVPIGDRAYRIERLPRPSHLDVKPVAPAAAMAAVGQSEPIVVNASKRGIGLADYPGSIEVAGVDGGDGGKGVPSLEGLLEAFPQTASTQLGAGRNKIFVRGIADSSFNGPTQSTIGLYLGEQRLIYSAPNPELALYDMDRVELLDGPQGTLYGAGTLGGVIRMTPRAPDPGAWHAGLWTGGALTQHGEPGFDGAAMLNAPLGRHAALRVLGYGAREAGYVDDVQRGLEDVNRGSVAGFRAAALVEPAGGWTLTVSGFGQRRRTRDGQYIYPRLPGLVRESLIAQPFSSDILGGTLTVKDRIGTLDLVSTAGIIDNDLGTRYDSSVLTGGAGVQAYDEARHIRLITSETRLVSPQGGRFSWLAGLSLLHNQDSYTQLVTSLNGDSPPPFAMIDYRIGEYALFGEATLRLNGRLSATLGGRLVYSRSHSTRHFGENVAEDAATPPLRVLPVAALSWHPRENVQVYARYQRSYRTGGVTVERADSGEPVPTRFDADQLQSIEVGTRARLDGSIRAELAVAGFYTRWTSIQGDLIQAQGFPITRNIGDGWIAGMTASAKLHLGRIWRAGGAVFVNHSEIDRITPQQTTNNRMLPNVAKFTGYASLGADLPLAGARRLTLDATLRYVGTSFLDIDPTSQVRQGNYFDTALSATLRSGRWRIGLAVTNLLGTRGNRFAFGNPFAVRLVEQATPLRPRQVRLTASWSY